MGWTTAKLLAREGSRLAITDVDKDNLTGLSYRLTEEIAEAEVEVMVGDASVPEDAKAVSELPSGTSGT